MKMYWHPVSHFNIKTVFPGMVIPMFKMRQSQDHILFNMGIPTLTRLHLYIEMTTRLIFDFKLNLSCICKPYILFIVNISPHICGQTLYNPFYASSPLLSGPIGFDVCSKATCGLASVLLAIWLLQSDSKAMVVWLLVIGLDL